MTKALVYLLSVATVVSTIGCGADGKSDRVLTVQETSGPLLPWQAGNSWTYRVTGDGESSIKVTTVQAEELVGGSGPNAGKRALKVVTTKGARDQTISWQALEGERVVRYREQSFHAGTGELEAEEHWVPSKLHFDEASAHTAAAAVWLEEYQETKIEAGVSSTETERDSWSVDAVEEIVTVPAGRFRALVVQKAGGGNLKTYWYVPGVGKVKETGGQTEELVEYKVAP